MHWRMKCWEDRECLITGGIITGKALIQELISYQGLEIEILCLCT